MSDEQVTTKQSGMGGWFRAVSQPDHSHRADPNSKPGVLRSAVAIELHTHDAQRLIYGYRSESQYVQGLIGFASAMGRIMAGMQADDPFADLYIEKVEHEFEACKSTLTQLRASLDRALTSIPGMNIGLSESVRPITVPMGFASPYGYRAAALLREYDDVARAARTGKHIGLLGRDEAHDRYLYPSARVMRRLFLTPFRYAALGLTRRRLRQEPELLAQAESRMGSLPVNLLIDRIRTELLQQDDVEVEQISDARREG